MRRGRYARRQWSNGKGPSTRSGSWRSRPKVYSNYSVAIREYERMIMKYYSALLLSEHTEPTESGLLALKKDTVPFDRPDGQTYTYGVLNMGGEGYMAKENKIQLCIRYGVRGQGLLEAINNMEEYLPEYHDVIIGYVYHEMSRYLTCLSLYSDGLVDDLESCNPPAPMSSRKRAYEPLSTILMFCHDHVSLFVTWTHIP